MMIVANLAVVIGSAAVIENVANRIYAREGGIDRRAIIIIFAVPTLLLAEQFNRVNVSGLDRSDSLAVVASADPVPPSCDAFFIRSVDVRNPTELNVDAQTIAVTLDIPTINGYSGNNPPGWSLDPLSDSYVADVAAWLEASIGTSGVCSYDRDTGTWRTDPFITQP
jgi:hypothetical protein